MKLSKRLILPPPPTKHPLATLWLCLVLILPAARADEDGESRGRSCRYVTPVWEKSDFGKPIVELSSEKHVSVSWNADEIILTGRSCIQAFEVEQQVSQSCPKTKAYRVGEKKVESLVA